MDEDSVTLKMSEVVDGFVKDVSSVRTGKASTSLVSDIVVPAYGGTQKLKVNELGTINAQDPQTIVIDPWDKSIIGDIKKGIELANVGLNPVVDGEIIRISIPPMTGEDREKLVKLVSAKVEAAKVMVRQLRGDVMKDIKESFEKKEITEDEKFRQEKVLQEITDSHTQKIDELGDSKKSELQKI